MRWILFHEAAVKDHLEICQTIMWSLEISNFTNLDPFKVDKTPEILGIATAKRKKLRLSPQNTGVLYPQPKPKISRRIGTPDGGSKYIGIHFEQQHLYIYIQPNVHVKAKTIRNLTSNTVEVKFKTTTGTRFLEGFIVAHGGKDHIFIV